MEHLYMQKTVYTVSCKFNTVVAVVQFYKLVQICSNCLMYSVALHYLPSKLDLEKKMLQV